jgi:coproporphyrinogen III oxidase-like Fe-S oxidoreductase
MTYYESSEYDNKRDKFSQIIDENPFLMRTVSSYTFNVKYYGGDLMRGDDLLETIILDLENQESFGLYLHYPFCRYLCTFCHYPVLKIPTDPERANQEIVDYLIHHLDVLLKKIPKLKRMSVSNIYLGGGTPSLLPESDLTRLVKSISERVQVSNKTEWTIESSPDSLVNYGIDFLVRSGFNRISTGIQVLSDNSLEKFHRGHSVDQSIQVLNLIKKSNYEGISFNVDLMYGLPNIDNRVFWNNIRLIAGYNLDSITLYRLRLGRDEERLSSLYSKYALGMDQYPDQLQTLMQITEARNILEAESYIESPLGWFHKERKEAKIYKDRWLDQKPMFGIGVAAYSYGKNWQFFNHKNIAEYKLAINGGDLPYSRGFKLNSEEEALRAASFKLRYFGEICCLNLSEGHTIIHIAHKLVMMELGNFDSSVFKLNNVGKAFIDEIIDHFFQKYTAKLSK